MLIVIGGDDEYRDKDEEAQVVLSRWARRKVESQFDAQYLDGRKSFIFYWNKGHREIHEKALEHYLDPSKKGKKFQYVPKQKATTSRPPVNDSLVAHREIHENAPEHYFDPRLKRSKFQPVPESIPVNAASRTVDGSDEKAELHFLDFGKKEQKLRYVPEPQPPATMDVSEEVCDLIQIVLWSWIARFCYLLNFVSTSNDHELIGGLICSFESRKPYLKPTRAVSVLLCSLTIHCTENLS